MPVTWFKDAGQALLDLLLPPHCVHCKSPGQWLCENCVKQIPLITPPVCDQCGTPMQHSSGCLQCRKYPLPHLNGIRTAAHFDDNPIRSAIHYLKYRNHQAVASALAQLLVEAYHRFNLAATVIVPVPLHRSRLKSRGYNQCELFAQPLASSLKLPINTASVQRVRNTKSQMTLGADERLKNMLDAFTCVDDQLVGQSVLLVDDVCTTGATLNFCAAAIKQKGAAAVWGLTLAKAL